MLANPARVAILSCPADKLYFSGGRDTHPTRFSSNLTVKFRGASVYPGTLTGIPLSEGFKFSKKGTAFCTHALADG